jgi:tRNA nucleotidyltransferase (CCA-adding enzyme)
MSFPERLEIPDEVLRIARKLEEAGFETWCVGGAVRDNLLEYANKDFDLATAATPPQVRKLFKRTVPIGIEHGTVAVLDRKRQPHEVTTFRRDVKTDGRHAVVEFGVSLEEDLGRRDFTINAIAYHPLSHEWRDPFDGAADLDARLIRAVGEPADRFREDYLRILRALRFAAKFGFEIERNTREAAAAAATGLQGLSAERVREEWFRGLEGAQDPSAFVMLWEEMGALGVWLPELSGGEQLTDERWTLVDRVGGRDAVLATAYLSNDPETTLSRLKCSNAELERGKAVGRFRNSFPDPESTVDVRRWMSRVGDALDDLLTLNVSAEAGNELKDVVERVRESGAPLTVRDLAVRGSDLVALGIEEGPAVGRVLRQLLNEAIEDPTINTSDVLLKRARELGASAPRSPLPDADGRGGR